VRILHGVVDPSTPIRVRILHEPVLRWRTLMYLLLNSLCPSASMAMVTGHYVRRTYCAHKCVDLSIVEDKERGVCRTRIDAP
jgi:hypothetical protein